MGRAVHSQDRDVFVIHHPENAGDALVFYNETDAFECWKHQSHWYVDRYNPIENEADTLTDEWLEHIIRNTAPEPRQPRFQTVSAYSAMRVAAE